MSQKTISLINNLINLIVLTTSLNKYCSLELQKDQILHINEISSYKTYQILIHVVDFPQITKSHYHNVRHHH